MSPSLGDRWYAFWFRPEPTSTLAFFRIIYGFLVLAWASPQAADALSLYGPQGVLSEIPKTQFRYGVLQFANSNLLVIVVFSALILGAVSLIAGYRTRVASIVVFVVLVSLRQRNPWHWSGGDALIRNLAFFMMFAPAGAAVSMDRWRKARHRFWVFPKHAPWAMRLMQIQIAAVYLFTAWTKGRGAEWWDGTASGNVMHVADLARFVPPHWFQNSLLVSNALTWGTMGIELALGVLIWNRRARPYVIVAGLLLHLNIELTMQLGFFSAVMLTGYVTFIPEDTALRWWAAVRRYMKGSQVQLLQRIALLPPPPVTAEPAGAAAPATTIPSP